MKVVTAEAVKGKKVLLRLDLDVPLKDGVIQDDTRLKAGMETLDLCLDHAKSTVVMGHIGRPHNKVVESLSVKPIVEWLEEYFSSHFFEEGALNVLENLRFEAGEDGADLEFAKELAKYGEIFINDAFAAHHKAASTTVLPTLLPSFAGLRFAKEVETLKEARDNPKRPLVVLVGGVKAEDKYPAVVEFSKFADFVLVGGLLAKNIKDQKLEIKDNVKLATLREDGLDISDQSIEEFKEIIKQARQIIWAGPMGKYEDPNSNKGSIELAKEVIEGTAFSIIGGGDTTAALSIYLDKFSFVSTGGGAMLKLLLEGTLPTIEALENSK